MSDLENGNSNELILVVDDEEQITRLLDRILSRAGYHVAVANSGEKALELTKAVEPDLIIMDILMPGIDGYEAAAKIKQNNQLSRAPVIFLSGRPSEEDGGRAFAVGGAAYLRKPFNDQQIRGVVELALRSKRSAVQNR